MDSLHIDIGIKHIAINDDLNRVITFNPSDVVFAEKFYNLIGEFETKQVEYSKRFEEIDLDNSVDGNGIPVNSGNKLALLREACEFIRGKIDWLFGDGTSQTVFGDAMTLDMFAQFFDGIKPFIEVARTSKIEKYANGKTSRSKVMK